MDHTSRRKHLRNLIARNELLVVPGCHDALSAMLVERADFPAVYLGSYAVASSQFGLPDVGLLERSEIVAAAKAVVDAVSIPVIADAESGWVDPANIWRTVDAFERAGVSAIHIEDHAYGKHASVEPVIAPMEETCNKIAAAVAARNDPEMIIIGRTDVPWAIGDLRDVVRRLNAYKAAGADVVMPAGIAPSDLKSIRHELTAPVMITDTDGASVADEQEAGANLVLYYGLTVKAAYSSVEAVLEQFKQAGSLDGIEGVRNRTGDFEATFDYKGFEQRSASYPFKR